MTKFIVGSSLVCGYLAYNENIQQFLVETGLRDIMVSYLNSL